MKTFKEFMNEFHLATYRGVKLFPTDHSRQRELERNIPKSNLLDIHKKVVDKIHNGSYNPPDKSFMVFDKSSKQTMIMHYRKDKYDTKTDKKHLFIVSGYDPGDIGKPRMGQSHLMVEQNFDILEI